MNIFLFYFFFPIYFKQVHRVLEFQQRPFLAPYIRLNTEMRQKAVNAFEKDFFKLMNNAMFGMFYCNKLYVY